MHLCIENLEAVDMDALRVVHSVFLGLVAAPYVDLRLLELHTMVTEI